MRRHQLLGIVGEDAQASVHAEEAACRGDLVVAALVVSEPQAVVGVERGETIPARLHQHAVARLGGEAGAASFLRQVEEDAPSGRGDCRERGVELLGAVAVARTVHLAGDARGVHACQQRSAGRQVAAGDGDGGLPRREIVEEVRAEAPVDRVERPHAKREERALDARPHRDAPGSCFCVFITWK